MALADTCAAFLTNEAPGSFGSLLGSVTHARRFVVAHIGKHLGWLLAVGMLVLGLLIVAWSRPSADHLNAWKVPVLLSTLHGVWSAAGDPVNPTPATAPITSTVPPASLGLASINPKPGDHVELEVVISTTQATRGAQFALRFDPTKVRIDSLSEGSYFKAWAQGHAASTFVKAGAIDNAKGTAATWGVAVLGAQRSGGPSGRGTLATIGLTVLAEGASGVALTDVKIEDASPGVPQPLDLRVQSAGVYAGQPMPAADQLPDPQIVRHGPTRTVAGRYVASPGAALATWLPAGSVLAWGADNNQQTEVPAGLSAVLIAAGYEHNLALQADGTVVEWGQDHHGEGILPDGLSAVTALSGGAYHSLALLNDGTVVAWGDDMFGQVDVPEGLNQVTAIAAGYRHSLALTAGGTVVAWGCDSGGQVDVPPGLSGVIAIAAGAAHSVALKADGTVVAWGDNQFGQIDVPAGLSDVKAIAAGMVHSLALKGDGTVVAWGDNGDGQIDVPPGLSGVKVITAGDWHSLALRQDDTLVAWGDNGSGQSVVPPGAGTMGVVSAGAFHTLALQVTRPPWDVNGDHVIDVLDLTAIGSHWGERGTPGWIPEDANQDGVIDVGDTVIVGAHWGETW
jgi:hypothetical protein